MIKRRKKAYILEIEEGLVKEFILLLLESFKGMVKHNLEVGLKETYLGLWWGVLVGFFNEIVKTLGLHKFLHKVFIRSFKLI